MGIDTPWCWCSTHEKLIPLCSLFMTKLPSLCGWCNPPSLSLHHSRPRSLGLSQQNYLHLLYMSCSVGWNSENGWTSVPFQQPPSTHYFQHGSGSMSHAVTFSCTWCRICTVDLYRLPFASQHQWEQHSLQQIRISWCTLHILGTPQQRFYLLTYQCGLWIDNLTCCHITAL